MPVRLSAEKALSARRMLLHHALVPAELDPSLEARWLASLPARRAASLARLRSAADRIATLLGMALLADCARAAGLAPPSAGEIVMPARGKPRWIEGADFSISHSGGRVACALAPRGVTVGLDIEAAGTVTWRDLRLVTHATERERFATAGLDATSLWTSKEAVVKAAGAGLAAMREVEASRASAAFRGRRFLLRRPRFARGFACAVALSAGASIRVRELDGLRLLGEPAATRCGVRRAGRESPQR